MLLSKSYELWTEVVRVIPSLAWVFLTGYVFLKLMPFFTRNVLPNLSQIKVGNFEVALRNFEQEMEHVVEIAEKNPNWEVHVPENDKKQVIRRINRNQDILKGAKILMFDDQIHTLVNERRMLEQLGIHVAVLENLSKVQNELSINRYDLLVSDIARSGEPDGLDTAKQLKSEFPNLQIIFYIGDYEPERGVPIDSFGITDRPDELVHLIIDVLERKRV